MGGMVAGWNGLEGLSGPHGLSSPHISSLLCGSLKHPYSMEVASQNKSRNHLASQGLNLEVVQHHFCLILLAIYKGSSGADKGEWIVTHVGRALALREGRNG